MPDPTPTETAAQPAATDTGATQGDPADTPLGANGEKALKAERERAARAEKATADLQKQLDAISAANMSELEKAQKAASDAQAQALQAGTDAMRFRIAAETGITDNVDLILTASDEETMRKQAELWGSRTPTSDGGPRPDLTQGGNPAAPANDPASQFAQFMKQQTG